MLDLLLLGLLTAGVSALLLWQWWTGVLAGSAQASAAAERVGSMRRRHTAERLARRTPPSRAA